MNLFLKDMLAVTVGSLCFHSFIYLSTYRASKSAAACFTLVRSAAAIRIDSLHLSLMLWIVTAEFNEKISELFCILALSH